MAFSDQAVTERRHNTWSPSKLFMWQGCAAQAKFKHLDKLPDPPGPALARGSAMHKAAELFINGEAEDLCAETKSSREYLLPFREGFKKGLAFAELELAFKDDWTLCGWFDPYVWVRFKLDAVLVTGSLLKVVDFKSGKLKTEDDSQYQKQLELYVLALLEAARQAPEWLKGVEQVTSELWFFDALKLVPYAGGAKTAADREGLREKWGGEVGKMLADTLHVPTPSFKCRWCPYRKGVGPCRFGA